MTLRELCDTNWNISLLNVYVRDEDLRLQHTYRIGARAKRWMCDTDNRTTVLEKPVHVQDKGASNFEAGFVEKSVPKQLLDLAVWHWKSGREYGCHITDCVELDVDVISGKTIPQITARAPEEDEDQYSLF